MYKGTKIQVLDLPGIIEGAASGKGRGKEVIAVARSADLVLMILDAGKEGLQKHRDILTGELESVGIRLNKHPPDITLVRKKGGGIKFNNTVPLPQWGPDPQRVALDILKQHKVNNAEILVRCDCTIDDFIDVVMGNRKYIRCLYAYNKIDTVTVEEIDQLARNSHSIVISVNQGYNMDYLLERVSSYCSEGGSEGDS